MYCLLEHQNINGNKLKIYLDDEVVGVQQNNIAGFAFHPN